MKPRYERTHAQFAGLTSLGASVRSSSDLTRPELWALVALVGIGLAAHFVLSATIGADTQDVVFQAFLTLLFAIAAWKPPVFAGIIFLITLASLALDYLAGVGIRRQ